ncbi:hypothetical protein [Microcoleus sp. B9-D4]|uniref:hypothetical protein n=1 Tax=Microcoleus sp. B9-D4 TaxID=2818711 RepID=UPI002FCF6426
MGQTGHRPNRASAKQGIGHRACDDNSQQSTVNSQQSTVNSQQSTVNSQLSTVN